MQQYFSDIKKENDLLFKVEDLNHIKNVMRMKNKEKVLVVYDGTKYLCEMNNDLKSAFIKEELETKEKHKITAYVPVLQEEKMSFIIQKGTELGVTSFIPVEFQNCKYKIKSDSVEKKVARWNKIALEASCQSRRVNVPLVSKPLKVSEIKADDGVNILCSLDKKNVKHISEVLTKNNNRDTISLVFGPEGGIQESEEQILVSNGFIKTSLGEFVLRTETVIIYITSIIEYLSY